MTIPIQYLSWVALLTMPAALSARDIYSGAQKAKVDWLQFEEAAAQADVIIFGEEHDDKAGHTWKREALQRLAAKYPVSLSLEMLERDQQVSVDEYLRGEISEQAYLNSDRFWPNYAEHYHPLLKFAKEKKLPVVAANVPKRYANLVAQSGLPALYRVHSPYLPPLYLVAAFRQKHYEERVAAALAVHGMSGNSQMERQKFVDAQYLWDASMSDAVAQAFYVHGRKVVHVNGRFHSEFDSGVTHRLRTLGLRVLTVSIYPAENVPEPSDWPRADFLVLTAKEKPAPGAR
jgi:uncharacterized iron-regulated protein